MRVLGLVCDISDISNESYIVDREIPEIEISESDMNLIISDGYFTSGEKCLYRF